MMIFDGNFEGKKSKLESFSPHEILGIELGILVAMKELTLPPHPPFLKGVRCTSFFIYQQQKCTPQKPPKQKTSTKNPLIQCKKTHNISYEPPWEPTTTNLWTFNLKYLRPLVLMGAGLTSQLILDDLKTEATEVAKSKAGEENLGDLGYIYMVCTGKAY